jgi:hypothetical protein
VRVSTKIFNHTGSSFKRRLAVNDPFLSIEL